jgi:hypothetical protein
MFSMKMVTVSEALLAKEQGDRSRSEFYVGEKKKNNLFLIVLEVSGSLRSVSCNPRVFSQPLSLAYPQTQLLFNFEPLKFVGV